MVIGTEIFILLEDADGTMRSTTKPTGEAVATEAEAKSWVTKEYPGYKREYITVKLVEDAT